MRLPTPVALRTISRILVNMIENWILCSNQVGIISEASYILWDFLVLPLGTRAPRSPAHPAAEISAGPAATTDRNWSRLGRSGFSSAFLQPRCPESRARSVRSWGPRLGGRLSVHGWRRERRPPLPLSLAPCLLLGPRVPSFAACRLWIRAPPPTLHWAVSTEMGMAFLWVVFWGGSHLGSTCHPCSLVLMRNQFWRVKCVFICPAVQSAFSRSSL